MSYDITFCAGDGCPRKQQCHRYKQLLRFRADKDPNRGNLISMFKPTDTANCTFFWKEKGVSDVED